MDIREFARRRHEVFHLTARENLPVILKHGKIYSTNRIIDMVNDESLVAHKRIRRPDHVVIKNNGDNFWLRDQRPLNVKLLSGCLTNNWSCEDFYEFLNARVFTWPTLNRLKRHYGTYKEEKPVILVFNTATLFELNPEPLFAKYNTGATRAHSKLEGKAPARGKDTFLKAEACPFKISEVAEVTFMNELILPDTFEICYEPEGGRETITL